MKNIMKMVCKSETKLTEVRQNCYYRMTQNSDQQRSSSRWRTFQCVSALRQGRTLSIHFNMTFLSISIIFVIVTFTFHFVIKEVHDFIVFAILLHPVHVWIVRGFFDRSFDKKCFLQKVYSKNNYKWNT